MRRFRTALVVIAINNLLLTLGMGLWQSLFNNFAVEELGIRAGQIGLLHAIREVPGLLGFLVGLLALLLVEMRIAGLSVVVLGLGLALTAMAQNLVGLIGATLVMSVGFHFFYGSYSSAVLITVGPDEAPKVLGRVNSLGAFAAAVSTLLVLLTLDAVGYRTLLLVSGMVVLVGGLVLLPFGRQPVRAQRVRRRSALKRRYWLYYALQFLMGSRRHIFTTFATFLLVKDYGVTPQTTTLLFLINSLIGTYFHQAFGKIVARVGERRVMTLNFMLLTLVFLGYAFVPSINALEAPSILLPELGLGEWTFFPSFSATPALMILLSLFVIDNVLFGFSIAIQSFFQKIAVGPEDITPNISLGQTINHIAAVIVPIVGGVVWEAVGARYTFLAGVAIAILSLVLAQWMRPPRAVHPGALDPTG